MFRCRHPTADGTNWKINGSFLKQISSHINVGNSRGVNTLSITARSEYNSTTVQCVVFFLDAPRLETIPAILLIQGLYSHQVGLLRIMLDSRCWPIRLKYVSVNSRM